MPNIFTSTWKNRQLITTWARYNIESEYLDTRLGVIWIALQPILMTLVYSVVFSLLLDRKPRGGVPYVIFFLSGMTLWQFFSTSVSKSASLMANKVNLITQIKFPIEALVISSFLEKIVDFIVTILVLMTLTLIYGFYPTWTYLYLPILLLTFFSLSLGIMFILSAVGVFIQDIAQMISIALRFLFYFSGILISGDMLPKRLADLLMLNPMFFIVEAFRNIVLYAEAPDMKILLAWLAASLCILFIGFSYFKSMDGKFADYQ